jgi:hypothetical protein
MRKQGSSLVIVDIKYIYIAIKLKNMFKKKSLSDITTLDTVTIICVQNEFVNQQDVLYNTLSTRLIPKVAIDHHRTPEPRSQIKSL